MSKEQFSDADEVSSTSPLLPVNTTAPTPRKTKTKSLYSRLHVGPLSTAALLVIAGCWLTTGSVQDTSNLWAPPKGPPQNHFPTASGFEGPTPTGREPMAGATAYPSYRDTSPIRPPTNFNSSFNILEHLGNLSPWRSVNHGVDASPQVPPQCEIEQVQLLHRHGARYPTTGAGPAEFASEVVGKKGFKAHGDLSFLNDYEYKLGAEILTPFGRQQLFALGVSFREKYGQLLDKGPLSATSVKSRNKPVFRTETQDRMLKSALNFAAGFFGIPFEEQYHQLVTIEWPHYNNTLSPYMTCINANRPDLNLVNVKLAEWLSIYLAPALKRFSKQITGHELVVRDLFNMQLTCAYELVSLGGSEFCEHFNEEEWRGFDYAHSILFYYLASFGQAAQAAVGLGWVQEWLARVTETPLVEFNSTTNRSYHSPDLFPLDQAIYIDASHDTILSAVITTLGFSSFASSGPLPADHIPADLSFVTSSISPFAANLHSQIASCGDDKRSFVRWILNDGVIPLSHIPGCSAEETKGTAGVGAEQGWCGLQEFVAATRERANSIDWAYDCLDPYDLGDEPIVDGRPPNRPQ